jgi:xylulokinase
MQTILALDLGTSSAKAALVTLSGQIVDSTRRELRVLYPRPNWAEQEPESWWQAMTGATRDLWERSRGQPGDVAGIIFSSQMLGMIPVDESGAPLMNCMIWLDTRSRFQARRLTAGHPKVAGYGAWRLLKWLRITNGAPNLAGRDPISKMVWLREERPDLWQRTYKLLDVKDYLLFRSTGRMLTTYDFASSGWLLRTRKHHLGWSQEILDMVGIPRDRLPDLIRSTEIAGTLRPEAAADLGLPEGIPVVAGAGDVTSSAVGSGAVRDGEIHLSLGTSALVTAHLDDRKVDLFSAIGTYCAAEDDKYLLIASQETACASLEWMRTRILGEEISHAKFDELVASAAPGAGGVHFFPWFAGERVPVDDSSIHGGFVNLALDTDRSQLARAIYEGISYNTRWALRSVEKLLGGPVPALRLVGGGAHSTVWCQVLADVFDRRIERVEAPQFSAVRGAALIALRALGKIDHLEEAGDRVPVSDVCEPRPELRGLYDAGFDHFLRFYRRNRSWFGRLNEPAGENPLRDSTCP